MAFQPGLINDMRPGRDRPPPAGKIALSAIGGWLSERPRTSEIDRARLIESDGASTTAVIRVHELNTVGQIARNNRRMAVALYGIELICYHTFDCRWTSQESSATH
jgi:hypothetical protein